MQAATYRPISSSYEVNCRTIQSCEEEFDLGILVDCDLTSRAQVCDQAAHANKFLGYIRRNARYIRSTSARCTLYLGVVRAHFSYATQVWAPQGSELISKLQKIQRRATKFILRLPFITEISYKKRLISLDLLPLCYWHELLDRVFFDKTTHNLVHLSPKLPLFPPCVKALERLEHPLLAFLSLSQRDVERQHIGNLFFLLEQPESGTYALAEWS